MAVDRTRPGDLPSAVPGAYVLVLDLARPCAFETRLLGTIELAPGGYLYCGSARGPGGLRARIARHLRADKALHWHIDHLTRHAAVEDVIALPGRFECELVDRLRALPGVGVPVAGFGSSDCRRCPAHLLSRPAGLGATTLARHLRVEAGRGGIGGSVTG